jgi:phosphomevalonate kinase
MDTPLNPTAASCPAKVFVAGGYLVLDRKYNALVFSMDARIHTVVEPIQTKAGVTISEIVVTSPQFKEAIWEYGYRFLAAFHGLKFYMSLDQSLLPCFFAPALSFLALLSRSGNASI